MTHWRWEHFKPCEVLSKVGLAQYYEKGDLLLQPFALDMLEQFRRAVDAPMICNHGSATNRGYRCPAENAFGARGAPLSRHVQGIAFDLTIEGFTVDEMVVAAKAFSWPAVGAYYHHNFIHVDARSRTTDQAIFWRDQS